MLEGLFLAVVLCMCINLTIDCIGVINFWICVALFLAAFYIGQVKDKQLFAVILMILTIAFALSQWDFERSDRPPKMSKKEYAAYNERKAKEREEERVAEREKEMEEIRVKQEFEDAKRYELEHKIWAKRVPLPENTGE